MTGEGQAVEVFKPLKSKEWTENLVYISALHFWFQLWIQKQQPSYQSLLTIFIPYQKQQELKLFALMVHL